MGGSTLGIDILMSDEPIEADKILRSYTKALDARIGRILLLAIPKLSEKAKLTAETNGVKYAEAENLPEATEKLGKLLSDTQTPTPTPP